VRSGAVTKEGMAEIDATIGYSEPDSDGHGWHVVMANNAPISASFQTVAVCLGTRGFLARDARASVPASVKAQIARETARVRAAYR
jgi:hypothetical protein